MSSMLLMWKDCSMSITSAPTLSGAKLLFRYVE